MTNATNRLFHLATFTLLSLACLAVPAKAQEASEDGRQGGSGDGHPNVVVILADDMGWADLGHDGSGIRTPHLDRLAREGVKLTQFYASAPICSPTRAALLTGRYPHSVGVPQLANPTERGGLPILALDSGAVTIPEALGPHGYHSALVGKWHLGYAREGWPRRHGFDYFWGSLLGTPGYWQPADTYRNETPIEVREHFTDAITAEAVAYLEGRAAEPERPFFLFLAYNAPHYPLEAPAELVYDYRRRFGDEAGLFALYAAMVEQMDAGIGRVLEALARLGLEEDTLVLFTSDNGPSAEPKGYGADGAWRSAGPLRGAKFSTHEGGIRVPFLARWPGRLPAGLLAHAPATTADVLPTVLAAAGLPALEEVDGRSILPLLRGEPFRRAEALHWETQRNLAVREGTGSWSTSTGTRPPRSTTSPRTRPSSGTSPRGTRRRWRRCWRCTRRGKRSTTRTRSRIRSNAPRTTSESDRLDGVPALKPTSLR